MFGKYSLRADRRCGVRRGIASAVIACAIAAAPAIAADTTISVLTGSATGPFYALGEALAKAIDKAMPNARTTVQATRSPVESLGQLQAGRGEVAFAPGDTLSNAWKGNEAAGFKTPQTKLRGIAAIYPSYIQFLARADSGIRTLADVKGKKISVGIQRSAIELNARALLHAAGIEYKDFAKIEYAPFGESIELMKERQIDITLQSAAIGASALRDLANAVDVVVVPIPADVLGMTSDSFYIPAVIPAHTYRGQSSDVPTAAVMNYVVTQDGVSTDTAYAITRAMWTSLDQLIAAHPAARTIDIRNVLEGMPVPLHPGAEKYYREVGLVK